MQFIQKRETLTIKLFIEEYTSSHLLLENTSAYVPLQTKMVASIRKTMHFRTNHAYRNWFVSFEVSQLNLNPSRQKTYFRNTTCTVGQFVKWGYFIYTIHYNHQMHWCTIMFICVLVSRSIHKGQRYPKRAGKAWSNCPRNKSLNT